jgi:hypothetical protein
MMPMTPMSQTTDILPEPPATELSYNQSAQLMMDNTFRGRVKTACLKYAESIMNEDPVVAAHNTRMKWAAQCFQSPDTAAQQVQPPTVMDPAVQTAGSGIPDNALQAAVEGVINKMM